MDAARSDCGTDNTQDSELFKKCSTQIKESGRSIKKDGNEFCGVCRSSGLIGRSSRANELAQLEKLCQALLAGLDGDFIKEGILRLSKAVNL
jgi:hypothetical protein